MKNIFITLLFFLGFNAYCQLNVTHTYLIEDVSIIDVETGGLFEHKWIGIDSNRISRIYKSRVVPSSSTIVLNGVGKFVLPGFWDMHIHYYYNYKVSTPFLIANGIVGVREMSGDMQTVKKIREEMKSGLFNGPEIYSSGKPIYGDTLFYDSDFDYAYDSVSAVKVVEKQFDEGVDFLKVYGNYINHDVYYVIANEAKKHNLPIAGHIPLNILIWDAIKVGQKSFEHNLGLLEATSDSLVEYYVRTQTDKDYGPLTLTKTINYTLDHHNSQLFNTLIKELAKSETWVCPTLIAIKGSAYQNDSSFTNHIPEQYIKSYTLGHMTITDDTAFNSAFKRKFEFDTSKIKAMADEGVKIIAGSDFPSAYTYPGFSIHDELKLFCMSGLSNLQALQTATLNPALFLDRLEDYGTVEENKIASLVILNSNPLINIENTKDIESIFLKGNYYARNDLDKLLQTEKKITPRQ